MTSSDFAPISMALAELKEDMIETFQQLESKLREVLADREKLLTENARLREKLSLYVSNDPHVGYRDDGMNWEEATS